MMLRRPLFTRIRLHRLQGGGGSPLPVLQQLGLFFYACAAAFIS